MSRFRQRIRYVERGIIMRYIAPSLVAIQPEQRQHEEILNKAPIRRNII